MAGHVERSKLQQIEQHCTTLILPGFGLATLLMLLLEPERLFSKLLLPSES